VSPEPGKIVWLIHVSESTQIQPETPARSVVTAAHARTLLDPLVTLATVQGATIRDQAETIGRLKAELEAVSAEVRKANRHESQVSDKLGGSRSALQADPAEASDAQIPITWSPRWRQGVFVAAVITAVVLVVAVLLFVLPPLDAGL